jgi:hypothetical protein
MNAIFTLAGSLIDKLIPDKKQAAAAKLRVLQLEQEGQLTEMSTRMSAIIEEAKSADPWTSRARPTFMYVIYLMILSAIPMGVVAAFDPTMATAIATGMQAWLAAIPDGLWATFGIGYSGYSVARSIDKKNALKK